MANITTVSESAKQQLLKELRGLTQADSLNREKRNDALGGGADAIEPELNYAFPIAKITDLESNALEESGSNLIPVELNGDVIGFMVASEEPALGGAAKPSILLQPTKSQNEKFKRAVEMARDNFGNEYRIIVFEHRPLQLKAVVLVSDKDKKYVIYQASRKLSKDWVLPILIEEDDFYLLIRQSKPISGITDNN